MTKRQPDYLAYMVRLWRANDITESRAPAREPVWRVSIENPHTRERQGFASLEALFEFFREQIGVSADLNGD